MKKYRKKPLEVTAYQWFSHGEEEVGPILFYRDPTARNLIAKCAQCGNKMCDHGRIKTLEGYNIVCPGDWIITGIKGEMYPCKPHIFQISYEEVT